MPAEAGLATAAFRCSARAMALAALGAGPLVILLLWLAGSGGGAAADPGGLGAVAIMALPASLIGAMVAAPACLAGVALLGWLGLGNEGVRLPVFWLLAGALPAGGAAALVCPDPPGMGLLIGAVGGACALACRWGMDWADEALSEPRSGA